MIDLRQLEMIYQQWMQGNSAYIHRWAEFIELAAKLTGEPQDEVMRRLRTTYWFQWGDK